MRFTGIQDTVIRPPAVAGTFYPADPETLRQMVLAFLAQAQVPDLGSVRAVIAPHAGYIYSGPVAGYAFKALAGLPARPRTVYLMGPAHYVYVPGIAVATFQGFATPLGTVPVASEIVDVLLAHGRPFLPHNEAHVPEHSLEVELPFLQTVFPNALRIVPMLFGEVDPFEALPTLTELIQSDPNAIVVVSSDLSHYHDYWTARELDLAFLDAVLKGDLDRVREGEACGLLPIMALMGIARRLGWTPHLLDYRNSGDTAGDKSRVVGYAAVAYAE
ncbi:MAG: AmmeMemoRadiSam system protein B [Chloroflexi bacterium]|nr:AmmeMemoRadiSam system protein B [Chloroflexota bacterium]